MVEIVSPAHRGLAADVGFSSFVTLPPCAAELALVAHLAIATAAGIPPSSLRRFAADSFDQCHADATRVTEALDCMALGRPGWRATIEALAAETDTATLNLVAVSFCTYPLFGSAERLSTQVTERRRNALLDVLDLPYSSFEVQNTVRQLAHELIDDPAAPGSSVLSHLRKARPVAEALSLFHPLLGFASQIALDNIPEDSPIEQAASFDEETLMMARIVAGLTSSHAVDAQKAIALPVRDRLARAAVQIAPRPGGAAGDDETLPRLTWAATVLSAAHDLAPDPAIFDDLLQLPVGLAATLARSTGAVVTIRDGAGQQTTVSEDESWNWQVTGAVSSDGKTVQLQAVRPSQSGERTERLHSERCHFLAGTSRADLDRHWAGLLQVLEPGTELKWMAKATNLWLCATNDEVIAYQEENLNQRHAAEWRVAYTDVRRVETNKEWFDWFIRIHTSSTARRANFAGNRPLSEDIASRIHASAQ